MKFLILIPSFIYSFFFPVQEGQRKLVKVQGIIFITQAYCGGARPTEEAINEYYSAKPYGNKTIYIRKGSFNDISQLVIAKAVSDSTGHFLLCLPKGTYCVVDENKKDKTYFNQIVREHSGKVGYLEPVNLNCLEEWLKKPDIVFTVGDNKKMTISVPYYSPCPWNSVPCTQYSGPLPP
jgi:hypothetical protein